MPQRTVRARRLPDGHFEFLEPVNTEPEFEVIVNEPFSDEGDGLARSAGVWAHLLDCDRFERDLYERRHTPRIPGSL